MSRHVMFCRLQPVLWLGALASLAACRSAPLDPLGNDQPSSDATAGAADRAGTGAPEQLTVLDGVHISSDAASAHFQRAAAEVDFGTETVSRAVVHVSLESPCFPFEGWAESGVPQGQRWPERCDAFDRALSLVLDAAGDEPDAPPGLELLRAVTPFGGPLEVEADVTDAVNGLPGKHQLELDIDTWGDPDGLVSGSKGEWIASVRVELWPGAPPRRVLAVLPLVLEAQSGVEATPISFDVPEGAGSARLEYRVTGHGSAVAPDCLGPAEEFCRRTHELRLDGALLAELTPWRDDCSSLCTPAHNDSGYGPSSYCAENPCGAPQSVVAPRANWCPGSATPPVLIEAQALTEAGSHELTRSIPQLAEGGSWRVSASYFAFE